jgi:DNA-binding NarL/FixJ family response regulator
MRVVVAEDVMLTREGIVRVLADAGVEVVGTTEDADGLLRLVHQHGCRDNGHQDATPH